jgi:hypothetical protein
MGLGDVRIESIFELKLIFARLRNVAHLASGCYEVVWVGSLGRYQGMYG